MSAEPGSMSSKIIREGWALKFTEAWHVKAHVGWIPGPPWRTREEAEEKRRASPIDPECFEVVPAVMYEDGLVVEVARVDVSWCSW